MEFKLSITMDNAAFFAMPLDVEETECPVRGPEVARILRQLALRVERDTNFEPGEGASLQDSNGNTVGEWSVHA